MIYNLQHRRKPAIQLDEEQTVSVGKLNPSPALPLEDDQLLLVGRDLGLEPRLRWQWGDQNSQNEPELDHPVNLSDSLSRNAMEIFGTHGARDCTYVENSPSGAAFVAG
jgi:hypothetical protein